MAKIKRYIYNGAVTERPKSLNVNGWTYVPPTDEILLANGWTIDEVEASPLALPTNNAIRACRQRAYTRQADKYFIAYQAYMELGETEKAEESKALWLAERAAIDKMYPYIDDTATATEENTTDSTAETATDTTEENTTDSTAEENTAPVWITNTTADENTDEETESAEEETENAEETTPAEEQSTEEESASTAPENTENTTV